MQKTLTKNDLGQKLVIGDRICTVVESISGKATAATKLNNKTIETFCHGDDDILTLTGFTEDGLPIYDCTGGVVILHSNIRLTSYLYTHYSKQLSIYS